MPQPNLIHPLFCVIEPVDRASTDYDEDAREEVQVVARAEPVRIQGQLSSSLRTIASAPSRAGRNEEEDGYILFRRLDLKNKGLIDAEERPFGFAVGDRITSIADVKVALYVIRAEPLGTYAPLGFTLVKAFCSDRKPARTAS